MIINTGAESLHEEVAGPRGWIIAKDIDIALLDGGAGQRIIEMNQLAQAGPVGVNENIYLQGHGSAGMLGATDPAALAELLRPVLPQNYAGTIYSLSCSAGVPGADQRSGVENLARALDIPGLRLEGAAGVALNHPSLPGAHRVVVEDKYDGPAAELIEAKIDQHQVSVQWEAYIENDWDQTLQTAARAATAFSEAFYIDVTAQLEELHVLLPSATDTTVVTTHAVD